VELLLEHPTPSPCWYHIAHRVSCDKVRGLQPTKRGKLDTQAILAGVIGASLTFGAQHALSVLQHRRDERTQIIAQRKAVRDRFIQVAHRMGQQTGDYLEASCRGSVNGTYWEEFRVRLNDAWRDFSDAMVFLPGLGDSQLLHAARRIHTLFALRLSVFYSEHADAIKVYIDRLRVAHPELVADDFHWSLEVAARNRKLYWKLVNEIDDETLRSAREEFGMSLRDLRAQLPPAGSVEDRQDIYDREDCWPYGSLLVMRQFRH
jgi:hypothetical protein